ncbi:MULTISPECIES: hypothetical protein [Bacillus]|uniref:hypothetical protein n=1 Tax=Bacillus TaxID=1386 RepID=UPI0003639672|nr:MULTISPECIES: hypothetical protein [Bacillus]PEO41731.1 hypothetical protein CN559_26805 [Bacillus pseudomycoides]
MKKNKIIAALVVAGFTISAGGYYVISDKHEMAKADVGNSVELEKSAIQNKMVNSIDNFQSAKGSFTYYAKLAKINDTIDFDVNLKEKPASFYKVKSPDGNKESIAVYDGEKKLDANSATKEYMIVPVVKEQSPAVSQAIPAKERYIKDESGNSEGVKLRKDPANMGLASEVLFSQNIALGFLEDYNKWKFEVDETYLGLPAKVITGEVSDNFKERHGSSTFKMWVHKDTGILLNFEEYDSKGDKVVAIKVNDIKLNTPSDVQKFKIQELDGYKRLK